MSEVATIYDQLFQFESRSNDVNYPIHKKLQSGLEDGLLDWISAKVDFQKNDRVLDAGCGTGHTLFYLFEKYAISGTGISISQNEVKFARCESKRLSCSEKLEFIIKNYDEKLPRLYNKVVAIESLKHSDNLLKSLTNLLQCLIPGGQMIIADDFIAENSVQPVKHKKLWQARSFTTKENLEYLIGVCGNFGLEIYDLTNLVPTRSTFSLLFATIMAELTILIPFNHWKRNLETYKGALLLERLYKNGEAKYYVFIIKKKNYD